MRTGAIGISHSKIPLYPVFHIDMDTVCASTPPLSPIGLAIKSISKKSTRFPYPGAFCLPVGETKPGVCTTNALQPANDLQLIHFALLHAATVEIAGLWIIKTLTVYPLHLPHTDICYISCMVFCFLISTGLSAKVTLLQCYSTWR